MPVYSANIERNVRETSGSHNGSEALHDSGKPLLRHAGLDPVSSRGPSAPPIEPRAIKHLIALDPGPSPG